MKYKDYYEIMGVPRAASQDEIKKTYRKLARQYHPDVNKSAGAEARFKEISEANEVLSDPDKRKRYDELGSNWQAGQDFRPPPGWENVHFGFGGRSGTSRGFSEDDMGGFSDFFETLFGRSFGGMRGQGPAEDGWYAQKGQDHEAEVSISLRDAYAGARKSISLQVAEVDEGGRTRRRTRTYDVRIPAGTTNGARIRLAGQGGSGVGGGESGDLYLRVSIEPDDQFRVNGHDLEMDLAITPWEAALGDRVNISTPGGTATISLPAGARSGQRLRLRGRGLPHGRAEAGDLYVVIQIAVPPKLTAKEKELFEQLAEVSSFNPRK
ncbi:MAG: cytochrome C biogenesis protein [Verrucomicrobia bacterium]|nr:cytochrome C biogenesis protein [Verrucomicrobiota bacterium]